MNDFFVSYSQVDRTWAEWIAWVLAVEGYTVVTQAWDARPGPRLMIAMQRAMQGCRCTVAVLSENYFKAAFVQPEGAAALVHEFRTRPILPVRVGPCRSDDLLGQGIYVDLVGCGETAARAALLTALRECATTGMFAMPAVFDPQPEFPGAPLVQAPTQITTATMSTPAAATTPAKPPFPSTPVGLRKLINLLASLFKADELRRFVRLLPDGPGLSNALPGESASPATLTFETATLLERHGLVDNGFFDALFAARPQRDQDINAVRALFTESSQLGHWANDIGGPGVFGVASGPGRPTSMLLPSPGRLWRVPDLPDHYLPRPGAIAALEQALLGQQLGPIGITATGKHGLHGMGGIGKSVVAAALCRQPAIRQCYPDGIYWLTVGQRPQLLPLQAALARELGETTPFDNVIDGRQRLRDLLADKAVLVVLDDVWDAAHANALEVVGERSCMLITTRDRRVLQSGAEHSLDVLPHGQALALLGHWVGHAAATLPTAAVAVAEACGRLPLALATIGAMVRADELDWGDASELLTNADLADLEVRFPGYPYPSILATIEVSVNAMDECIRARYFDLAIFPGDEPIPEAALEVLWDQHRLTGARLRRLLRKLVARSLATRDPNGHVRLHDLQRMYVKKRAGELPYRHGQLVDAYAARCPAGWSRGQDDGYFLQRLPWHLAQSNRYDQLADLLFDYDWLDAKLRTTNVAELVADFELLPAEHHACSDAHRVRDALCLSSHVIAREPEQLPSQLIGRLGRFDRAPIEPLAQLLAQSRSPHGYAWFEPLMPSLTSPGGPLLRTLSGHHAFVMAVAVTADGKRAISASYDRTLKVWDLDSGHQLRTLSGHAGGIMAVAVTADGKRAISASRDSTLKVWDLDSGHQLLTLVGHASVVRVVTVTPDGKRAISASDDRTLKVWDLDSGHQLRTLVGHADWVTAVAVTADGKCAISASGDQTLKVWDLDSGHQLDTLSGHAYGVNAVAVTADGKRAISASDDRTLKVWDLDSGHQLLTLSGHTEVVTAIAVTADDKRAISASWDQTLKVWDLDSGYELHTLSGHASFVMAVAVTVDGQRAISASWDQTLKVWNLDSDQQLDTLSSQAHGIMAVAVTVDSKRVISSVGDYTLKVWDLDSGDKLQTLSGHADEINAIAVTADSKRAITASDDHTLKVWNLDRGRELYTLSGHTGWVNAVAVTADGKRAISVSWDKTMKVWDLDSGHELETLSIHPNWINAVAVIADGNRAILADDDHTLKVWALDSGHELYSLFGHAGSVNAIAVTADGKRAVSASDDHTLRVWDLNGRHELCTLSGHAGPVTTVALTRDDKRAISASSDQTVKVWDLNTGDCLATFTGEAGMVTCATNPSASIVVAGDTMGHIYFLSLVEAGERRACLVHTHPPE